MYSLKAGAQQLLLKLGLYYRLKESLVYDTYWRLFDPRIVRARDKEIEFYRKILAGLSPGALIFDVGANEGAKTDVFLRLGTRIGDGLLLKDWLDAQGFMQWFGACNAKSVEIFWAANGTC